MRIDRFFDSSRRRRSEELASLAERAEHDGDLAGARERYAEAAALEEESALNVSGEAPRVRSVLSVSAVALWLRAERWDEAARAGCTLLSQPTKLTPDGRREVQALLERAWRTSEVEQALGTDYSFALVETTFSGGLVCPGLAPRLAVAERRDLIAPLLVRVAEWKSKRRYRRGGPSVVGSCYDFFEAPAIAGGYSLRLYLGATMQRILDGVVATPADIVDQFLQLAEAAVAGPDEIGGMLGDAPYVKAFLRGFRDLAPDGHSVGEVGLGTMVRGRLTRVVTFTTQTREHLSVALYRGSEEKSFSFEGVLKYVNLRGGEPKIGLDTDLGARVFRLAKGEHDDTISPKLNRRVYVLGERRMSETGEADEWAEDIVVLGEGLALDPLA